MQPERRGFQRFRKPTREELERIAAEQAEEDHVWDLMVSHEPEMVIAMLEAAFEDNASPSACIDAGKENDVPYVTVLVTYPTPKQILDVAGSLSVRDNVELYSNAVASTVIATVNETFAVAPAALEARVVVVRHDTKGMLRWKRTEPVVIFAGTVRRTDMPPNWQQIRPIQFLKTLPDVQLNEPESDYIQPIELKHNPDLRAILEAVAASTTP